MASPALALVPKRMSLYELVRDTEGIADLVEALDAADELTEEVSAQLSEALCLSIAGTKDKIDRSCGVLASFEAAQAAAKAERDRLDLRVKYFARQAQRLEDYLMAVLVSSNLKRMDGNTSSISRTLNPASAIPDGTVEGPLAPEFVRTPKPAPWEPDKTAIKAAITAGKEVPGWSTARTQRLVRS
jgi:hypothetical protein